jgi:pyruvate kinase
MIGDLLKSGMSVARLNLSHGSIEEHGKSIQLIRSVASRTGKVVAILADLPGPKMRIGELKEPLTLKKGDEVTLTTNVEPYTIPLEQKDLPQFVSLEDTIYLNDGLIQLRVKGVTRDEIRCRVLIGGELLSHKGVNLPGIKLPLETITDRDLEFLNFGLEMGVDAFGISFVERAKDIAKAKRFAEKRGKSPYFIAKIEREAAVENIDEILEAADGIMVARGDLGTEIPIEQVPAVQKRLIRKANSACKPVITATQMLESMLYNPRPTRAEVTDVANAILDGTDAVMLSEETAIGRYPVEAVEMAAKIATAIEPQRSSLAHPWDLTEEWSSGGATAEDVISLNAVDGAHSLGAKFIITPTHSGSTPRHISRFKPDCWILSFSEGERTRNFLAFSYGVYPSLVEDEDDHSQIVERVRGWGLAESGDRAILTAGISPQGTDSLRIITL